MDVAKIKLEMRLLAEARITKFVGEEEILLSKSATARVFNKSLPWVDQMIAAGRLPTIRAGPKEKEWIQRPAVGEGLVNGV
jgi:hypothetical protein